LKGGKEMKFKNKKGVFGLTSVQAFFAIMLSIALLGYIIIVVMGTLDGTTILTQSVGARVVNESVTPDDEGTTLSKYSTAGCAATVLIAINSSTNNTARPVYLTDYKVVGCVITNLTSTFAQSSWNVTYDWTYDSPAQNDLTRILGNTSSGISGFFGNISPVYAILAILVIILVLIVLTRVVQGGTGGGNESPQL
jgi:hypothetical protein